ncbi:hypothetical protein ACNQGB_10310 [Flavobacterium sp. XS1P32]|uniref:hypothetical protein n=1 Tax=Flavobacterium sp. XS1P32 TaxID=3401726 RepID=UPI003AAF1304
MKLTVEQIEYVANYVNSFDIKWYELQVELTDHMVNSMEEIWEKDPELTFHQVKQYAENRFGRNGFKAIEKERIAILRKEYNRIQRKMITEYLKFPKIFGSILLGFLAYQVSFYFEEPHEFIFRLNLLLLALSIPFMYSWIKNQKINGKRFLAINSQNFYVSVIIFPQCGIDFSNNFKEEIQQNHLLVIPYICFWVLGILFSITGLHINTKIVAKIKKQYQLN